MSAERLLTVAYRVIEVLARASVGLDQAHLPLVERAGITPEERATPDARVPVDKMDRFWDVLVEHTGDECIGLRLAARLDLEAYGPFGAAVRAGTSIEDTVANANRFGRLLHDAATWRVRRDADVVRLSYGYEGTDKRPHRQAASFGLGGTVELFRRAILVQWVPRQVCFEGPPPRAPAAYEALLGAPVAFEQTENAIVMDAALLDHRLISGDPGLSEMYRAQADRLLAERASHHADTDGLLQPIRAAVIDALPRGEPTLETIAQRMAVSPRTLQRRLRALGMSFHAILDDTRLELTLSLMKTNDVSITQVAFLVGYSDPSAFRRAFKRWTNQSPQQYQAAHRRPAGGGAESA